MLALDDWSKKWEIKLNVGKCVAMRYGRTSENGLLYNIDGEELKYCEQIKDLGVTFQRSLQFTDHIYEIINKSFSLMGLISRNYKDTTKDSFVLLYKDLTITGRRKK